ncbi:MAG: type II toxin-antitoxin system RelE/ParE family toxin [Leptolyngbyaceae cyanobacterium]
MGKRISASFFATESGHEPVREWLKRLPAKDRRAIGEEIKVVEFGWSIGMPTCKPMGDGLHEVQVNVTDGKIARVLFCTHGSTMVLLHGFIKKSQKTPKPDLDLAKKRKKEVEKKDGK